jgi:hypothetical protein
VPLEDFQRVVENALKEGVPLVIDLWELGQAYQLASQTFLGAPNLDQALDGGDENCRPTNFVALRDPVAAKVLKFA